MNRPLHDPAADPDPEDDTRTSDDFARALEDFERGNQSAATAAGAEQRVTVGTKVRGRIVSVGPEHALVDFGGRSEAVVETRFFRSDDGTIRIMEGEVLDLFVVEAADQVVLAPSLRTDAHAALAQLRGAHASGIPVSGRVTGLNAGGLTVEIGGARGFCPVSQIEAGFCADPSVYVGRTLEFVVTGIEESRRSVLLSRRQLLRKAEEEQAQATLASLKPGEERDGTVSRIEPFGAFVDLGGMDGLVHVSEIGHERLGHPGERLRVGERVRVRVLRIEPAKERGRPRISLSIKATAPDPWTGVEARFAVGSRVTGVVSRLTEFGAFVSLAPGIDGLVHVSEAGRGRVDHVRNVLAVGQSIEALVLGVDPERKRVSLSVRRLLESDMPEASDAGRPAVSAVSFRPDPAPAPAPAPDEPPGPMAIALRRAMEKAREKERAGGR